MEKEEIIEKGYGNVTFGSEGIRPGEYIEREKGELEKGTWGSSSASTEMVRKEATGRVGEKGEEEKGQTAGDRVLSRHLAEENRDEEEKRISGEGKGRNLAEERKEDQQTREDEHEFLRHLVQDTSQEIAPTMSEVTVAPGHDTTAIKAMILAAAAEEIDRGETTMQAMVVAAAAATELGKKNEDDDCGGGSKTK